MHFVGVFNRDGGTFRTMDMELFAADAARILGEEGHTLEVLSVSGAELLDTLNDVVARHDADVLLAGGGDGTISAAAGAAFRGGKPLAVLPAGTMNLFARSLQLPLDVHAALRAIAGGTLGTADIATANGRPFVHQYSVGLHTRLVRIRERMVYRSRLGKIWASLNAIVLAIQRPPRFVAEIRSTRGLEARQCSAVIVSNNPFGEGHIPHADRLDSGRLGVYVTEPVAFFDLARLSLAVMLGRWKQSPFVLEREVSRVSLRFPKRKSSALATIDGELVPLEPQVDIELHPGGLQVVVPAAALSAAA